MSSTAMLYTQDYHLNEADLNLPVTDEQISNDQSAQFDDLQESFARNLQNLEQVAVLMTGTLPSLCSSTLDMFTLMQKKQQQHKDIEYRLKVRIQTLQKEVLRFQQMHNSQKIQHDDQEMENLEQKSNNIQEILFGNKGFAQIPGKNDSQNGGQNQVKSQIEGEYESFFDINDPSSLRRQYNEDGQSSKGADSQIQVLYSDLNLSKQKNLKSNLNVMAVEQPKNQKQSWFSKKDGKTPQNSSQSRQPPPCDKENNPQVNNNENTTGSQTSNNENQDKKLSQFISQLQSNANISPPIILEENAEEERKSLARNISSQAGSPNDNASILEALDDQQDPDSHQMMKSPPVSKTNLIQKMNSQNLATSQQYEPEKQEDESELTIRNEIYKNTEDASEVLAARKVKQNKYMLSKSNTRSDAAVRYRDKHLNLETNYKKNKERKDQKRTSIEPQIPVENGEDTNQVSLTAQFLKNKKETKYRETERNRDKRRAMKGQACFRCEKFYQILDHDDPQKAAEEICNECSRHRDNEPINNTPEQFYDLDI